LLLNLIIVSRLLNYWNNINKK